jgi:uncharacterized protein with ParB-like and HNH nuclease domain/predicted transport protein
VKASEARLLDFLRQANRLVIPIYQRRYSWLEKQCEQLWSDITRAGSSDSVGLHFVGSVVYIQDGLAGVMDQSWLVIDGQQRVTTVTLLLEALSRALTAEDEPVSGFSKEKIRAFYLQNQLESGDKRFKLHLSLTDDATLKAIIAGKAHDEFPAERSERIDANFNYFTKKIASLHGDLEILCNGLAKLAIVDISLNREQDNPQLIFESMNSTGKALSQADLIRNFILMGLKPEIQDELYKDHWRPVEEDFGQEAYGDQFDSFMRHYLTVKTGLVPREAEVYEAFKIYAGPNHDDSSRAKELVRDIHRYSRFYCKMALGRETDKDLASIFQDLIMDLNYSVAYPLLLKLYSDFVDEVISKTELMTALRFVESYVFRRSILEIPTNSMNKTFAEFQKHLDPANYMESFVAHFLLMPSYRRFPGDEEFRRALETKDLYNIKARSYWLRRLENDKKKELVGLEDCTIEHIMPQNPNLSLEWKKELGDDWEEIHSRYLHSLGNLTLTRYNSEYSDRPFVEKLNFVQTKDGIDLEVGLSKSPFFLNADFTQVLKWDEKAILSRAERLSEKALTVWGRPKLDTDVMAKYMPKESEDALEWSIDDHEYLHRPEIRLIFEEFRTQVQNLDSRVSETFLKQYVAYKAKSNFVDVIPQAKRLRLSLSIPIEELEDPRGLAKNITGVGRWGTGDSEVGLDSLSDLPYVLGLIRQALDRQIG